MAVDRIVMEVLEDGTAKVTTEGISGANHSKADQLVKFFARLLGGNPTIRSTRRHGKNRASQHSTESNKANA